jgi:hypothetical protein
MNGIIHEQNGLQRSGDYQSRQESPTSVGNIRDGKNNPLRQIVVERTFPQTDFDEEREYAHWGLNE